MGLFDWLKRGNGNAQLMDDRIWLTRQAKFEGIASDVAHGLGSPNGPIAIIAVAHFADHYEQLQKLVQTGKFDTKQVLVVMADQLTSFSTQLPELEASQWIQIVAAERHPLASHDELLLEFAKRVPGAAALCIMPPWMIR